MINTQRMTYNLTTAAAALTYGMRLRVYYTP